MPSVSRVTKAVVLARGAGTRMREAGTGVLRADQATAADAGAKAMMPLGGSQGGRPFLDYVLSALADAGYVSACLVVAPDHAAMRRYYEETAPPRRLQVHFAEQREARGTADAVAAAADFIGVDHTLVINGDNYYPPSALSALRALDGPGTVLFHPDTLVSRGNIPRERVRAFAVATLDADGCLARLIEKPTPDQLHASGPGALVSMNCWRLPPEIVAACRAVTPSARGELELSQAVIHAIDALGVRVQVLVSEEGVLDLSRREDVHTVGSRLAALVPRP